MRIDEELVRGLVERQLPHLAHLPVTRVVPGGNDNRTFRLGDDLAIRLPSAEGYAAAVEKEQRWLPELAPRLPLPIPTPVEAGRPDAGFPWPWSVNRWLQGQPAIPERIVDRMRFARDLAGFLVALRGVPSDGPPAGAHSFQRGAPPAFYDRETRDALVVLRDELGARDADAALAIWETATSSVWARPPVWFHGDIAWGNLLVRDGVLAAVIDFGTSGVGDPACDLAIAWTFFAGDDRRAFADAVGSGIPGLDAACWARGRGWTLWKALIVAAEHPRGSVPGDDARRVLREVLDDPVR